jgi:hypothetical protein
MEVLVKKVFLAAIALIAVAGVLTPALADYYATKADYRQGRVTRAPATPKAGTDDCPGTPIAAVPFDDVGDTTGAADGVSSIPEACNGNYSQVEGGDHVYTFDVIAGNSLTFTVSTTSETYDPSIYVLTTCGDGNTCVTGAAADNCFAADEEQPADCADPTETFTAPELAAGTYFFYVDSYYNVTNNPEIGTGPYELTVEGDLPVELIEFEVK